MPPAREPLARRSMNASAPPPSPRAFLRDYAGTPQSLRSTRDDVSAWLRAQECDNEMVERAVLVASELASNAVQAAPGRSYRVAIVGAGPQLVELTISNPFLASSPPDRDRWLPTTPAAPRGRGLSIVAALSRDVRVDVDNEFVRVTVLMQTVSDR